MKTIKIVLSAEAEEVYKFLVKESANSGTEKTILNSFNKKIELIKLNPHYGNPLSKKLIPKEYKQKYEITNLFRIELPNYWRMLYTLTNDESQIQIIAFIINITDHRNYNKLFNYKKR